MDMAGEWIEFEGLRFYVGHDRKTCPTYGIANTFGFTPGFAGSCDGAATHACASVCYADKMSRVSPDADKTLIANWETVRAIKARYQGAALVDAYARLLRAVFGVTDAAVERARARGIDCVKAFRLTWSGEIFCREFALALPIAMAAYPDMKFWGYTRARHHVAALLPAIRAGQLKLNLSSDNESRAIVEQFQADFLRDHGVLLEMFDMDDGSGQVDARARTCPAIARREQFPLAKRAGDVSPCIRCGICWDTGRTPRKVTTVHVHK